MASSILDLNSLCFFPLSLFFLSKKVTNPDGDRETRKSDPRLSRKALAGPADFHSHRAIDSGNFCSLSISPTGASSHSEGCSPSRIGGIPLPQRSVSTQTVFDSMILGSEMPDI